ncbi:MAG: M15 family metallopeptidase [Oscillospiraceae bacterium]|nr:M15 family metallopeptidase [Oscillospiraceae bacterium]
MEITVKKSHCRRVIAAIAAVLITGGLLSGCSPQGTESSETDDGTTIAAVTTTTATTVATTIATTVASTAAPTTTSTAAVTTAAPTEARTTVATAVAADTAGHYVQNIPPSWGLVLVNRWNPHPEDFFGSITLVSYGPGRFDSRTKDALDSMIRAGSADGLSSSGASLYRTIETQTKLFNNETARHTAKGYSRAEAEELASQVVARPGTSEHNTGLAVDFTPIDSSFENTSAFRWLQAHCAEYGFIMRFPQNKIAVTGVSYEPWHYRYVGVEAAGYIMANGITLEEYLETFYPQ